MIGKLFGRKQASSEDEDAPDELETAKAISGDWSMNAREYESWKTQWHVGCTCPNCYRRIYQRPPEPNECCYACGVWMVPFRYRYPSGWYKSGETLDAVVAGETLKLVSIEKPVLATVDVSTIELPKDIDGESE